MGLDKVRASIEKQKGDERRYQIPKRELLNRKNRGCELLSE